MRNYLPLIVGFGGFNAAGRSSGHRSYERMVYESLGIADQQRVVQSLSSLMGLPEADEQAALSGSLVRQLDPSILDANATPLSVNVKLQGQGKEAVHFELSARQMPAHVPDLSLIHI